MFAEYLAQPPSTPDLSAYAHRITEHVFHEADRELVRVAALQALVEDMYQQDKFTNDDLKKLAILELDIARKAWALYTTPKTNAIHAVPYLVAFSLIGGSPEVQRQFQNVTRRILSASREMLMSGRVSGFREVPEAVAWNRLSAKSFLTITVWCPRRIPFHHFPPGSYTLSPILFAKSRFGRAASL